jgi:ABC-2 type transport system permease protein
MTLWKLEIARLIRTKRVVALVGVFLFFGLTDPLITRYLDKILALFQSSLEGAGLSLPAPTVAQALADYAGDAAQIGTLVVVAIAAGTMNFDAPPEMGVFLRTRVPSISRILLPRVVVMTLAAGTAQLLGTVAAGYESAVLLGALPWAALISFVIVDYLALGLVVLIVGALAQSLRSTVAIVMASLGVLVAMPILGIVPQIGRWLPTRLLGSLAELSSGASAVSLWPAILTTIALGGACWWMSVAQARRREL